MKTNKRFIGIAVCLICSMGFAMSQEMPDAQVHPQHEKRLPREVPNPEKIATQMTDQLQKSLQLTDKQYKKIYKLNLKEQKERFAAMQNRSEGRFGEGEGSMRGGGRPHMGRMGPMGGMDGGEPPMMGSGGPHGRMGMGEGAGMHKDADAAETLKKTAAARDKKFKKILTTEQFGKWKIQEENNRTKAPRERRFKENHSDDSQELAPV